MSKIQNLMETLKTGQAGIISSCENRLYFSKQKTSAGLIIVTKEQSYFIIDFRYFNKVKDNVNDMEMILQEDIFKQINEIFKKHNVTSYFVETEKIPYTEICEYKEKINTTEICLENTFNQSINDLRIIKTEDEINAIKKAQEITDKTFSYILEKIKPGKTEREVALDMEFFARNNGSDGIAFDFIVVAGKKSALPHGSYGENVIQTGDFLTMDFGCVVDGYRSDMTRTVAIGSVTEKQKLVYETVLKAQNAALEILSDKVTGAYADTVARDVIKNAGFGEYFGHGLGHGVGIDIHEMPHVNSRGTNLLKPGMVITCEPGIYIANEFGVRIEDMGIIRADGFENITKSDKNLIIL